VKERRNTKKGEEKLTMIIAYMSIMMTAPAVTQYATAIYPLMTTSSF
jgi:hypothetical protein